MDHKEYLIRNNAAKERFARLLNVSKRTIQECIYELIDIAKANDGVITPQSMIDAAKKPTSVAKGIFNWNLKNEELLKQAEAILKELTFLIDRDGKIYHINTK